MDKLQDTDLVKGILAEQMRMEQRRALREAVWREIDERVNILAGGGFDGSTTFRLRGQYNFDATAITGSERCTAAIAGMTIPRNQQYIGLRFADKDLDKLPAVRRWCERAADRLYAIRYAPHAGFETQAHADILQTVTYGTAPFWIGCEPHRGMFYKAVHLSECYIAEDFRGRVDTVHRKFTRNLRQILQQYQPDELTPKMIKAQEEGKLETEFQLLTVVRPNTNRVQEALDYRRMPIEAIHIAIDEKQIMRRKGFYTMPIPVSRHVTGPGDEYGRSPAMKVLGTILGVNKMAQTNLRAANKAVDPALAFYNEDGLTSIVTRPGGANPGLMSEDGNLRVARMPGGENGLPIALEMLEGERGVIRTAFLEEVFKILTDPSDRMTATQVLETVAKQGVLVAPFAGRHETEKMGPTVDRELDCALRYGQIDPLPPEVQEAQAWPKAEFENPLSKMARAQDAAGLTRLIETMAPMAQNDPQIYDWINEEEAVPGVADVLSVRPTWVRSKAEVDAIRQRRSEQQAQAASVEQLATAAGAYKDLAAGNAQAAAA